LEIESAACKPGELGELGFLDFIRCPELRLCLLLNLFVSGCEAHVVEGAIFVLFLGVGVEGCDVSGMGIIHISHDFIVIDAGWWGGVGGFNRLILEVIVWVGPCVVFVGYIVGDHIVIVRLWCLKVFYAMDEGLKLHTKAFGLLVHAILHEIHHVGDLWVSGCSRNKGNVGLWHGRVGLCHGASSVHGHHSFLHERGWFPIICFRYRGVASG